MEKIKKRLDSIFSNDRIPALSLSRVDEEQKILYMNHHKNFDASVSAAFRVIEAFPEYAAVVFNFNDDNRTVVTRQMTSDEVDYLFWRGGWSRLTSECPLDFVREHRSTYEKFNEFLRYAIWESPEGIAAGVELDMIAAQAEDMLEPVKSLEQEMQPSKKEYESYLEKIEKIKHRAESVLYPARAKYHEIIYNLYKKAIEDDEIKKKENGETDEEFYHPMYPGFKNIERYYLARVSSECSYADIRKNPDGYSRVSEMLKSVFSNSPEAIAAGAELDIAEAEYLEILKEIAPLEQEMQSSKQEYESYLEKIKEVKRKAKSVLDSAKAEYHRTIDKIYCLLFEDEKDKRIAEAQKILREQILTTKGKRKYSETDKNIVSEFIDSKTDDLGEEDKEKIEKNEPAQSGE